MRKPRKPRNKWIGSHESEFTDWWCEIGQDEMGIGIDGIYCESKYARQLAAWLIKAADYCEARVENAKKGKE